MLEPGGLARDRSVRHRRELGEGPLTQDNLPDRPKHVVADGELIDTVTDRIDGARGVHARDQREAMLHPAFHMPVDYRAVERVQAGGGDLDTHLAFGRLRDRQVVDRAGLSQRVESECFHDGTSSIRRTQPKAPSFPLGKADRSAQRTKIGEVSDSISRSSAHSVLCSCSRIGSHVCRLAARASGSSSSARTNEAAAGIPSVPGRNA